MTALGALSLLNYFTNNGEIVEGWRNLPLLYSVVLLVMAILFYFTTFEKRVAGVEGKSLRLRLRPLGVPSVWRFGLYYFLVFGGFVALAQWLIPYYVNVYTMTVVTAGFMTSIFSLPSGVIRAMGGWLSDKFGPRPVMYWVLGMCSLCCALLMVPRM